VWTSETQTDMVLPIDDSYRFDLQFARRVLGKLLGLESRINWRDCAQTQAQEEADVLAFKGLFKTWDFSLEE